MITDLTFLTTFTKGDVIKMRKYIEMYLATGNDKINVMSTCLESGDYESIKVAAHTLKSQARYMGITTAENDIVQIEQICNDAPNKKQLEQLISNVTQILQKSFEELSEKLKTL
jgi:HPt (histidine-containing phosphotransfer) domain-containing protein